MGWKANAGGLAVVFMAGCPVVPDDGGDESAAQDPSTSGATMDSASGPDIDSGSSISATSVATATETSDEAEPWFEVGWGTDDFNAFDGVLPVVTGPQGLSMFSMPIRGAGFYTPPMPSFDNPDMPMLQAWVDIEGLNDSPGGHFNEVNDYPALFYPSFDDPGTLEGPAVWLVLPDAVEAEDIDGMPALLHAELLDADGLFFVEEYELVVEVSDPSGG
ncbi:MAG: hypothetical protein AAF799_39865 [Myxococcota bacterium]